MNSNRGMVKWQPFSAIIPGNYLVNKILSTKNKIKKPELSEEQLKEIENFVLTSYTNQEPFHFYYFNNGKILSKYSFVKEINSISKKILLSDGTFLFFNQIIKIKS